MFGMLGIIAQFELELRADGMSVAALTNRYRMTRTSVYRYLAEARLADVALEAAAD
jgi:hypothetical protein